MNTIRKETLQNKLIRLRGNVVPFRTIYAPNGPIFIDYTDKPEYITAKKELGNFFKDYPQFNI